MDVQSPTCLLQFCAASVLSLFPTCSVVLDVVPHTELELRTRAIPTRARRRTRPDKRTSRTTSRKHTPYFASKGTDRRIGFLTVAISYMYQD